MSKGQLKETSVLWERLLLVKNWSVELNGKGSHAVKASDLVSRTQCWEVNEASKWRVVWLNVMRKERVAHDTKDCQILLCREQSGLQWEERNMSECLTGRDSTVWSEHIWGEHRTTSCIDSFQTIMETSQLWSNQSRCCMSAHVVWFLNCIIHKTS